MWSGVPGVPAGLLFLLFVVIVPFSPQGKGSEVGTEEGGIFANMEKAYICVCGLWVIEFIRDDDDGGGGGDGGNGGSRRRRLRKKLEKAVVFLSFG